jgi:hypothetical protein
MNIQDIKVSPRYNAQLKISKEFTFWLKESLFIVYMHKIVMMIQIKFAIRLLMMTFRNGNEFNFICTTWHLWESGTGTGISLNEFNFISSDFGSSQILDHLISDHLGFQIV